MQIKKSPREIISWSTTKEALARLLPRYFIFVHLFQLDITRALFEIARLQYTTIPQTRPSIDHHTITPTMMNPRST